MRKLFIIFVFGILVLTLNACTNEVNNTPQECISGFDLIDGECVRNEEEEENNQTCPFGEKFQEDECVALVDLDIEIINQNIYLNGEVFFIKGVNWNPVPKGGNHPRDLDFKGSVEEDAALMRGAGFNVVRTYEPITDIDVLDTLYSNGIYVINTVYSFGGNSVQSAITHVNNVKDHPAILMWAIGNEWNYNGLYTNLSLVESRDRINEVAAAINQADPYHPITTIYGYIPSASTVFAMPDIDVWGLNVYSGITFGNLFQTWTNISDKPMYLAEYGADAWNSTTDQLDVESQAYATRELTEIIIQQSSGLYPNNTTIGGTIFSFNDEWWKDDTGSLDTHDSGGIAPGGGPYPDSTFNEEYWGIVDIDRNPRPAYYVLQELYTDIEE